MQYKNRLVSLHVEIQGESTVGLGQDETKTGRKMVYAEPKTLHKSVMSVYSDKLAHEQVVIKCRYSAAQMCTREDTLFHYLGPPFIDDVMRYNTLIAYALTMTEKSCLTTLNFAFS